MTEKAASYWEIRAEILHALACNDDDALMRLARMYPKVFSNVVAQARNATRKKVEH